MTQDQPTADPVPDQTARLVRVEIDPNIRVLGNLTRAGLEDADGPLTAGQDVIVYESESGLTGPGRVARIDHTNRLVYLAVDWWALREEPAPAPVDPALRQRVAQALLARIKQAVTIEPQPFNPGPVGHLLAATEYDLADTVLAALAPELADHEEHRKGIAAALGHRNDALWDDLISTTLGCRNSRKRWKDRAEQAEAALARVHAIVEPATRNVQRPAAALARRVLRALTPPADTTSPKETPVDPR